MAGAGNAQCGRLDLKTGNISEINTYDIHLFVFVFLPIVVSLLDLQ